MTGERLDPARLVYRWDLDKTYLRTEFDTALDLLRTALEPVTRKRAFPGAAALLREQAATRPRGLFILSGSPEQMRPVLEAKLRLDGVRWDEFTLKPSLTNLLRGRLRFVRDQVGYKLAALLSSRRRLLEILPPDQPATGAEILFGDDAEADAFVYSLYADLCAGRVEQGALTSVLEEVQVYPSHLEQIKEDALAVRRKTGAGGCGTDPVRMIFIHLARVSPPSVFEPYGPRVCPIYNYFQPACVLVELGALKPISALRVGADLLRGQAFGPDTLLASFLDIARRGHAGDFTAAALVEAVDGLDADQLHFETGDVSALRYFADSLSRQLADGGRQAAARDKPPEPGPAVARPKDPGPIDYLALYRRDRETQRALRARVLSRRRPRS